MKRQSIAITGSGLNALSSDAREPGQKTDRADNPVPTTRAQLGNFTPYLMNRIIARYNRSVEAALRQAGVSVVQMRALAVLVADGPYTVNELSVLTVVKQSTLSRTLDQMEAAGLIRREVHESDNRVRFIHATPAGRDAHLRAWPAMERMQATMLGDLSTEERQMLNTQLTRILHRIRRHDF